MSKEIYISSTPHETRLAIVEKDELTEIYYERENEYTLAGSIYNGRVTRVLPGMQSSFVDIGLERDAFLYITDFMEEAGDAADFEGTASEPAGEAAAGRNAAQRSGERSQRGEGRSRRDGTEGRGRREERGREASDDGGGETVVEQAHEFTPTEMGNGGAAPDNAPDDAIGEGAPGANGSRRWRGRRGRRRGRGGPNETAAGTSMSQEPETGAGAEPASELEISTERGPRPTEGHVAKGAGDRAAYEAHASHEQDRTAHEFEDRAAHEPEDRKAREESRRTTVTAAGSTRSSERAGRDRRSPGEERRGLGEERRDRFAARPPRGDAGHRSGSEEQGAGSDAGAGGATEPFILPGESLSKYRRAVNESEGQGTAGSVAQGSAALESQSSAGSGFATPLLRPRPSSEVEPLTGWDGGFVLPGESLSRHRESSRDAIHRESGRRDPGAPEGREPNATAQGTQEHGEQRGGDRGRDRRRERDARRGWDRSGDASAPAGSSEARARSAEPETSRHHSSALDPYEAVQPAVTSQHEPEITELPFAGYAAGLELQADSERAIRVEGGVFEPTTAEILAETEDLGLEESAVTGAATDVPYESETDSLPAAEATSSSAVLEAVEEFHETVAEYEPGEDASASFRVDPVGASEFRQNIPLDDLGDVALAEAGHDESAYSGPEPSLRSQFSATSFSEAPSTVTSEAPYTVTSDAAFRDSDEEGGHAFTSVQPSGEMISEEPPAHAETGEPEATEHGSTAPIEHESVVQSVHRSEAQNSPDAVPTPAGFTALQSSSFGASFEPGDGRLEEELLDEDDDELGALPMAGLADDTEEEVLELGSGHTAPDLGSMIRDISIDEITRPEPAALDDDDEDDFDIDEEELEEDELQSNGEYELDAGDEISGSLISETEEEEFAESDLQAEGWSDGPDGGTEAASGAVISGQTEGREREPRRSGERQGDREGRRDGRQQSRHSDRENNREARSDRNGTGGQRGRGAANFRSNGGGRERGGRTMQATHLPAISDLLKPGQEVLVQIAKEPMAKKGARITSHIALPGRFLVFMPTVSHVGVSRKIESDGERRRLKEILLSEKGEASGGFIVRTAASGASEEELRSDLRFLLNLWADIKQRSDTSKSPALIYHDLNLVERILRDQVTDNFSAIWVDTETEYERVLRFLQRFQPSLIRRVKLYTKDTPLFEQFGISAEIDKALRSKVWLKSGGSIVINQTEALVAIDINTGKYVGKTARLEDTIVKTNLDAIPEIVRQIRLRDLGGIIIIDFIDMDERKNRSKVMAALEEELKKDRAPSKVLQFNDFGLVAITRKRVKQSLERTLSTTCSICQGTGMTKSPVTVCNDIYIEMRKMHRVIEKGDIMLRVNPEVVKQLKSGSGRWLQEMEEMSGKTILVKSDPSLHPEQFDIH